MTGEFKKTNIRKIALFISGGAILVLGIALILGWWGYVVVIFKGAIGILLALAGLFILAAIKE